MHEPCYPRDNTVGSHLCDECVGVDLAERQSQACVHLVTDLASSFTNHRMSGLPIRARYKHFKKFCERTFDNSPFFQVPPCLN